MGVYLYIYSMGYRGLVGMNRIGWAPPVRPPPTPRTRTPTPRVEPYSDPGNFYQDQVGEGI